jgi:hypothetical protein
MMENLEEKIKREIRFKRVEGEPTYKEVHERAR